MKKTTQMNKNNHTILILDRNYFTTNFPDIWTHTPLSNHKTRYTLMNNEQCQYFGLMCLTSSIMEASFLLNGLEPNSPSSFGGNDN